MNCLFFFFFGTSCLILTLITQLLISRRAIATFRALGTKFPSGFMGSSPDLSSTVSFRHLYFSRERFKAIRVYSHWLLAFPTLATSVLNITVCYDVFKASIANEISQETVPKAQEERQMCLVSFPVNLQHLGGDSG